MAASGKWPKAEEEVTSQKRWQQVFCCSRWQRIKLNNRKVASSSTSPKETTPIWRVAKSARLWLVENLLIPYSIDLDNSFGKINCFVLSLTNLRFNSATKTLIFGIETRVSTRNFTVRKGGWFLSLESIQIDMSIFQVQTLLMIIWFR